MCAQIQYLCSSIDMNSLLLRDTCCKSRSSMFPPTSTSTQHSFITLLAKVQRDSSISEKYIRTLIVLGRLKRVRLENILFYCIKVRLWSSVRLNTQSFSSSLSQPWHLRLLWTLSPRLVAGFSDYHIAGSVSELGCCWFCAWRVASLSHIIGLSVTSVILRRSGAWRAGGC